MALKVAIVSRDPAVREAAARAFASAPPGWKVELCAREPGDADVVVHGVDVAPDAAIVFDPARPEEAVRSVAASEAGGRVYVVAAAAGGTGATTVALHLCAALARSCYAELTEPSARLGLDDDARTWVATGDDGAPSALPVAGGFRVLRAPSPCPAPGSFPLAAARRAFDHVVVDVGTRRDIECVVAPSTAAVVVTSPTRTAALAARALVERHPEARWYAVVNRLGPGGQIMRGGLEGLLGRAVALELPCCPALRDAEDEARLLSGTWRRWTRGVARLARGLAAC
ncbi:MAG TPA: hypothetical protein VHN37_01855 [Actinomycetota bacterium]|nr:hypothetical protein [Actinomycetota bacterium]